MQPPPNNPPQDNALFIVTPVYEKAKKLIRLTFEKGKPIQDLMSQQDKDRTGLSGLNANQLANLNAWLDPNTMVAPGPKNE